MTAAGYLRITSATGVRYCEAALLETPSYRHPFEKIVLETGRSLYLERRPLSTELLLSTAELEALAAGQSPERLARFEKIVSGLSVYF